MLMVASYASAQNIPEVVDKFQDTRALYSSVQNMQLLLSNFEVKDLRGFRADPWHSFLKTRGEDIINEE
ncbi:hypothetical protein PHBOTO_002725 [Pseudozyma hubeiensis]|nr:hypothetical protein PHBOTO_002725 [Pseudozyma hubeiensis]